MAEDLINRPYHKEIGTRSKRKKPVLTRPDTPPGSPSTNCAICLGVCDNKSYSDTCFHQFCFSCLLTWSQVKAECPLCKQRFNKIIYNIRSDREYDEHRVEQRTFIDDDDDISILQNSAFAAINNTNQRFRYRTTLTLERRHQNALEQLLRSIPSALTTHEVLTGRAFHHGEAARTLGFLEVETPRPFAHAPGFGGRQRTATSARRAIYERGLFAYPLPDLTGRFRESSPEFYRFNPTQIHRLVPWLSREITAILPSSSNVAYIITMITDLLPEHSISSHFFANMLRPFFNEYAEHFAHEFSVFASTPYDITGYDRAVQYRHADVTSEIVSDSDSRDSDIIEVPNPEPSHSTPALPVRPAIEDVITIETIDNSETDDSASEVMVVGYIKPPEQRTPPVVDLVASDSDVILQEDTEPTGAENHRAGFSGESSSGPLVKLSLRRKRPQVLDSDSDSDVGESLFRRKKKRKPRIESDSTYSAHEDISPTQSCIESSGWSSSASSSADSSPSSSDDLTVSYLPPRLRHKIDKCKAAFSLRVPSSAACSSACKQHSSCRKFNNEIKRAKKASKQNGNEKKSKRTKRASQSTPGTRKRRADVLTDSTDSYYTAESLDRLKERKRKKKSSKEKACKKSDIKSSKLKEKKQKPSLITATSPLIVDHSIARPSSAPGPSRVASVVSHVAAGASRLPERDSGIVHSKSRVASGTSRVARSESRVPLGESRVAYEESCVPHDELCVGPHSPRASPGPSTSASALSYLASVPSCSPRYSDTVSPSNSDNDPPKLKSVINVVSPWTTTEPQPSCSVPKSSILLKVTKVEDAPGYPVKYESLLDIMNTAVLNPSNGVLACQSSSQAAPSAASRLHTRVLSQVFTSLVDSSTAADAETKPLNLSFKKE